LNILSDKDEKIFLYNKLNPKMYFYYINKPATIIYNTQKKLLIIAIFLNFGSQCNLKI